ncbi:MULTISPECIES: PEGA domain-containing protein [Marinobacter]|nr:PEGA domain-containing protein [Marinobacter salarius]WOI17421.1 PEGA domain-containing protein [Marinobacter salarius]
MVDFRPLLFVNALALMLLVTAGFASVRDDLSRDMKLVATAPDTEEAIARAATDTPVKARRSDELYQQDTREDIAEDDPELPLESDALAASGEPSGEDSGTTSASSRINAEPFSVPDLPEDPTMLAMAEPVSAIPETKTLSDSPEPPTTGRLILRSNVVGDNVTINGKDHGATRLDLELTPGKYDVTIRKEGYKPWQQSVAIAAGNEKTLMGKLEAYTRVKFRNGTWVGGVKTGDGTYEAADGLRYEGHFVDGAFDGKGTLTMANGDILTGQWSGGKLNGHGSLTTSDGMLYVGGFKDDEFHGEGTLTYPDGRHYEGEFSNGEFHGNGNEVFADGKKYEGQYIEGSFHGRGLLLNPNGSSIEATFRYGEPYGQVRLTTAAGEVFTARTKEPGVCYREKSYRATQCPTLEGW